MNIKDFNLELALQGHPVITKSGKRVLELHFFTKIYKVEVYPIYAVIEDDCIIRNFTKTGGYNRMVSEPSDYDLYLEDINWVKPIKYGDMVEVTNDGVWKGEKRIFIHLSTLGGAVCVDKNGIDNFKCGISFNTYRWSYMRSIQPKVDQIDIIITVNGKKVGPNNLSEETWMKLRNGGL